MNINASYVEFSRMTEPFACRFFGSTIVAILSNTYAAANEVGLTVKLSALFGQLMAFYAILDQNFGLTAMVTSVLEKMYSIFSLVLSRYKGYSVLTIFSIIFLYLF